MTLKEFNEFPRKYEGFTKKDIDNLLSEIDKIDKNKFNHVLLGQTGHKIGNDFIYYKHDVYRALCKALKVYAL